MIWMIPAAINAYEQADLSGEAVLPKVIKLLELLSHLCEELRPSNYPRNQFNCPDHLKTTRVIVSLLLLKLKLQTLLPPQFINKKSNASLQLQPQPKSKSEPEPEPEPQPQPQPALSSPVHLSSPATSERFIDHNPLPDPSQRSEIEKPWDDREAAALIGGLQRHWGK
jgi:hypothetical protein